MLFDLPLDQLEVYRPPRVEATDFDAFWGQTLTEARGFPLNLRFELYDTVFAAYNYYAGPKQIKVWPYNHHEGGESYQNAEKLKFLARLWQ